MDAALTVFLSLGALFCWSAFGVNVGFQELTGTQIFALTSFPLALLNFAIRPKGLDSGTQRLILTIGLPVVYIVLVAVLSISVSADPLNPVRFVGRYVYGFIFLIAAAGILPRELISSAKIARCFVYGGVLTLALCIAGLFNSELEKLVFIDRFSHRAQGLMRHPNQLGILYATALPLAFFPGALSRFGMFLVTIALLCGVVFTGSKTNMAIFVIVLPLFFIWKEVRQGKSVRAIIAAAIMLPLAAVLPLLVFTLISVISPSYYAKVMAFADDPLEADTAEIRYRIWSDAWLCIKESPILGVGANGAEGCVGFSHAHNLIIDYALEMGTFGFVGILWLLFAILLVCLQVGRISKFINRHYAIGDAHQAVGCLIVSIVVYLTGNLTSESLGPAVMQTLWLLLALLLCVHQYAVGKIKR